VRPARMCSEISPGALPSAMLDPQSPAPGDAAGRRRGGRGRRAPLYRNQPRGLALALLVPRDVQPGRVAPALRSLQLALSGWPWGYQVTTWVAAAGPAARRCWMRCTTAARAGGRRRAPRPKRLSVTHTTLRRTLHVPAASAGASYALTGMGVPDQAGPAPAPLPHRQPGPARREVRGTAPQPALSHIQMAISPLQPGQRTRRRHLTARLQC